MTAPIPKKLREQLANDPYYKICARHKEGGCSGRITWEHALLFAGKQIQTKWSILPLCWYHHLGAGLNKEINIWIALNRASDEELKDISKARDYLKYREYLNKKYG